MQSEHPFDACMKVPKKSTTLRTDIVVTEAVTILTAASIATLLNVPTEGEEKSSRQAAYGSQTAEQLDTLVPSVIRFCCKVSQADVS